LLLRPNPCEGKFTSEHFPYCVVVPQGWQTGALTIEGNDADGFAPPTSTATVVVIAQGAPQGFDTRSYTQQQQNAYREAGLIPTEPRPVEIDGTPGLLWELSDESQTGGLVVERRITLVHEGMAWLIAIYGDEKQVDRNLPEFEGMLTSWSWK
jgi:hypothetical protein